MAQNAKVLKGQGHASKSSVKVNILLNQICIWYILLICKIFLVFDNNPYVLSYFVLKISSLPEFSVYNPGALFRKSLSSNIDFLNSAPGVIYRKLRYME